MQLRRPELRQLSLSLGVLVGLTGFLLTPGPWPTDPVLGIGLGACVSVLAWAAVEQRPDALDRAVEARAHWLVVGLGALPFVVVFGRSLLGGPMPDGATLIRLLVFLLATIVVASLGSQRRGMLLLEREEVRERVTAVESRWRHLVLNVAVVVTSMVVVSLATSGAISPWTAVGGAIGTTIGAVFTGEQQYELIALDDHLLFRQGTGRGASAVSWDRIRDVSVEDDTLRIARGLPYPSVYTADVSTVEKRRAVLEAFQSSPEYR